MNMTTMTHEDSMREMIINGIKEGLDDSAAGRVEEANDEFWDNIKKEGDKWIKNKRNHEKL